MVILWLYSLWLYYGYILPRVKLQFSRPTELSNRGPRLRPRHETSDHKATRKDEAERIKSAGGRVINTEYDDAWYQGRNT